MAVLIGNGNGTFQPPNSYFGTVETPRSGTVADINNDEKLDAIVSTEYVDNSSESGVAVLLGSGDGTFKTPVMYGVGGRDTISVEAADFNGDGKLDLLIGNGAMPDSYEGAISILLGNGDGTFQLATTYNSGAFEGGVVP